MWYRFERKVGDDVITIHTKIDDDIRASIQQSSVPEAV
jgi:hypothetical protein